MAPGKQPQTLNSATTGRYANSATTGDCADSTTTGNASNSITTGDTSRASAMGRGAVAASIGPDGAAKAALGNWIVCAEWNDGVPVNVRAAQVDGVEIKADTFYKLSGGAFVELA